MIFVELYDIILFVRHYLITGNNAGKGKNMKYRILLNSKHGSVISDFFRQTAQYFDCLSTSDCLDDIANHFKLFRPDAYVCFNEGAQCGPLITQMRALKSSHDFSAVPIIVIGDDTLCNMLERLPQKPDLIIRQSTAPDATIAQIIKIIQSNRPASTPNVKPASIPGPKSISVIPRAVPKPVQEPEKKSEKPVEVEKKIPKNPEEIISEPKGPKNSKANVLVIDDDRSILRLIKSACGDFFNITTMLNADLIDKFFENKTVDIILLDYEMPGENGPQVFQRLRKIPNASNIPVVFLTGVSDRKKIQEVLSLKPQGYVLKPINMDKLFETIYKLIR